MIAAPPLSAAFWIPAFAGMTGQKQCQRALTTNHQPPATSHQPLHANLPPHAQTPPPPSRRADARHCRRRAAWGGDGLVSAVRLRRDDLGGFGALHCDGAERAGWAWVHDHQRLVSRGAAAAYSGAVRDIQLWRFRPAVGRGAPERGGAGAHGVHRRRVAAAASRIAPRRRLGLPRRRARNRGRPHVRLRVVGAAIHPAVRAGAVLGGQASRRRRARVSGVGGGVFGARLPKQIRGARRRRRRRGDDPAAARRLAERAARRRRRVLGGFARAAVRLAGAKLAEHRSYDGRQTRYGDGAGTRRADAG